MEAPFDSRSTLTIRGVQTPVFEAGTGRAVVLLHGNPDSHRVWAPVVERLKDRFRCIAPDLPGFGDSRAPRQFKFTLEEQAAWVEGLLDGLKLARADLVVHDVGGPYGLSFTSLHPERLRSLTILNCSFFPDTKWHFWAKVWRTPLLGELAMLGGTRGLFVKETLKGSPRMPRRYAEEAWDAYSMHTRFSVLKFYRYLTFEKVLPGWDQRLLESIARLPTRVIWGDQDPYMPVTIAERFNAPVLHLPDAGHWAMLEEPDKVAAVIAEQLGAAKAA